MQFERVSSAKGLGVIIRNDLKWNDHVDTITSKAARGLYLLSQLKRDGISSDYLLTFCCSVIRTVLEFSCQLFHCRCFDILVCRTDRFRKSFIISNVM